MVQGRVLRGGERLDFLEGEGKKVKPFHGTTGEEGPLKGRGPLTKISFFSSCVRRAHDVGRSRSEMAGKGGR